MIDDTIYAERIALDQNTESFFEERMQMQPGIPFPVDPNEELRRKFYSVRDSLAVMPDRISSDFFPLFHQEEGWIGFQQKTDKMRNWGSIKTTTICPVLEDVCDRIQDKSPVNLYFTVNTYYKVAFGWKKIRETGLFHPQRKEVNLSCLNACYADIDVGRFFEDEEQFKIFTGSSYYKYLYDKYPDYSDRDKILKAYNWDQALLQVMILEEAGIIPKVSIYARSGRGIYLFWLLEPVKAFPEKIKEYKDVNKFLNQTLLDYVPADPIATDAARVLRVHGSLHGGSGTQVCYSPSIPDDDIKTYTLSEMIDFCNLAPAPRKTDQDEKKIFKEAEAKGSCPERANGVMKSAEYRFADLQKIADDKKLTHGIRYQSLNYLGRILRIAGYDEELALEICEELAMKCIPPYPSTGEANDIPIADIIKREFTGQNKTFLMKNESLARFWKIDKATAEKLNLRVIKPKEAEYVAPRSIKQESVAEREKAVLEIMKSGANPKRCLEELKTKYAFSVSPKTLQRIIRKLETEGKLEKVQHRAGRPPKRKK